MYQEFVVPDDQEVLETIGEWPETEEDSEARVLTLQGEGDEQMYLSYDALARSVRVRWKNSSGEKTLDIFREGATRMAVHSSSRSTYFSIEFQMGECAGKMSIQVFPNLAVTDQLLFA
ncbi:hypothetical protein AB0N81_25285 [Streptomyces sp. NPDC093510]|uniref:hypothetical protein n=1 Tax=Streptomyces sp. NPDC093510 TaxID=3155199 RepID=UPI00341B2F72